MSAERLTRASGPLFPQYLRASQRQLLQPSTRPIETHKASQIEGPGSSHPHLRTRRQFRVRWSDTKKRTHTRSRSVTQGRRPRDCTGSCAHLVSMNSIMRGAHDSRESERDSPSNNLSCISAIDRITEQDRAPRRQRFPRLHHRVSKERSTRRSRTHDARAIWTGAALCG